MSHPFNGKKGNDFEKEADVQGSQSAKTVNSKAILRLKAIGKGPTYVQDFVRCCLNMEMCPMYDARLQRHYYSIL